MTTLKVYTDATTIAEWQVADEFVPQIISYVSEAITIYAKEKVQAEVQAAMQEQIATALSELVNVVVAPLEQ